MEPEYKLSIESLRKFVYISLLLFSASLIKAQGIHKAGYLDMKGALYALSNNSGAQLLEVGDSSLCIHDWQSSEWEKKSEVDYHSLDFVPGTFKYLADVLFKEEIYLLAKGVSISQGTERYQLFRISEGKWFQASPMQLENAQSINDLIVHDGELLLFGVFSQGLMIRNMLQFADGAWDYAGAILTRSIASDTIMDVQSYDGGLYACGIFTLEGKRYTVAYLNNGDWKPMDYPPFIDYSLNFGVYRDKLVLFGGDANERDRFHYWDGKQWTNISEGMKDVQVEHLNNLFVYKDELYAMGLFKRNNQDISLFKFDGQSWKPVLSGNVMLQSVSVTADGVLLTMEDEQFMGYHFRKRMFIRSGSPYWYAGYYLDKDNNCSYQSAIDVPFISASEAVTSNGMRFFADQDGELAIPLSREELTIKTDLPRFYKLACNLKSDRKMSFDSLGIFEAKRAVYVYESRPQAEILLRPNLSWNLQSASENEFILCLKNSGSATLKQAKLSLRFSSQFAEFWSEWPPNQLTDSSATWQIENLLPNEERCFRIRLRLDNDLAEGERLKIEADIDSDELDWQENGSKSDELDLGEGEMPEVPVYKLSAQSEILNQRTNILDYKLGFQNETGSLVTRLRFIDTLDEAIRIDTRGIHYISSHPVSLTPSYFIDGNGKYRYVLCWTMSKLELQDKELDIPGSRAFVDFRVYLRLEDEKQWEVCNQASVFVNQMEPTKTNVVCNSYSDKLTIGVLPPEKKYLKIYPQPANGKITIEGSFYHPVEFSIFDLQGRELGDYRLDVQQKHKITLRLAPGTYVLRTRHGETHKLLIF